MKKYPDFWHVLIGNQPPGFFFGYLAVSVMAAFAMILIMATMKYKAVEDSPDKWSWKYFIANNWGNFVASLLVLPIFIRLVLIWVTTPDYMVAISAGLGFGFYKLAKLANNVGLWTTDKLSERIAEKIKTQSN